MLPSHLPMKLFVEYVLYDTMRALVISLDGGTLKFSSFLETSIDLSKTSTVLSPTRASTPPAIAPSAD